MKDKRASPSPSAPVGRIQLSQSETEKARLLSASNCFLCKQAKTKPAKMWSKQQIYAEENWFVLTNFRELLAHRSKV